MLRRGETVVFLRGFLTEILEYADSGENDHAETIGHDAGINEADTAGKEEEPFNPPCRDQKLADHGSADADHADEGGQCGERHISKSGVNAEHSRIHNKHVRNNKGSDAKFGRIHACAERIASGNGGARKGCESYRRGNISDDAEIEYKHMRCQNRHAQRNQGRCGDGGGNDIVRRSRNAHAEKEGCNHRAEKEHNEGSRGNIDKSGSKLEAYTGLGDDADDDARRGTGDEHAESTSGAFDKTIHNISKGHARIGAEHGGGNGNDDACEGCFHRGIAGGEETDNGNQRNRQVSFFFHDLPHWRQQVPRRAFQVFPFRFKMNTQEDTDEVENGRNNSGFHHFHVRNTYKFRHKEGRGAHNRRHELAAGGGGRFHGASKILAVTEFFHHRNGEGAGSDNIGHGAAGNGSFKSAGENRYFRGAAGSPAGDGISNINKEFPQTSLFEVCPEEDEEENEGRGHAERNAEYAFRSEEEMAYHLRQGKSPVRQWSRKIRSQEAVSDKAKNNDNDRKADNAPRRFNDHNNTESADHLIGRSYGSRAKNELLVIEQDIDRRNHRHNGEEQIKRMDPPVLYPGPFGRAEQVDQRNAKRQMDGALNHGIHQSEESCINLEQGEADADPGNHFRPDAAVLDSIGFFVKLLQLFFQLLVHRTSFYLFWSRRSIFLYIIQWYHS